eukprot:55664-Rhodomonas_salina.1
MRVTRRKEVPEYAACDPRDRGQYLVPVTHVTEYHVPVTHSDRGQYKWGGEEDNTEKVEEDNTVQK